MKTWLKGAMLLAFVGTVHAENYRIVQAPAQKLDVWIDNIKDNTPKSWCAKEIALRIVTHDGKRVSVLDSFIPRVGALLEHQCARLQQVNWTLVDASNGYIAQGTAARNNKWALSQSPEDEMETQPSEGPLLLPPGDNPEALSPAADRTPWSEFLLQGGCRLRTFGHGNTDSPALFIPGVESNHCEKGGWITGHNVVTRISGGMVKKSPVTFVHGFPVIGLNEKTDPSKLLITAVNNERMVLSSHTAHQSWMILPYLPEKNSWQATGTLAIEISDEQYRDAERLRARIDSVRHDWMPWLAPDAKMTIVLISALHPQLRNPAVSTYHTAN